MAFLSFKNIGISGVAVCLPRNIVKNIDCGKIVPESTLKKAIQTIGVAQRRIAGSGLCASDLCYRAALKLINEMNIDRKSIDMLLFVSQTPDFRIPATACILQRRLGLPVSAGAFDINLGCSGYVYGLSTAFSYASQASINRILLLVGDTLSKAISSKDRATTFLFGDGGTATLIEKKDDIGNAYFSLNTDGSGEEMLKIKSGGYRNPSNEESLVEKKHADGSIRNDEQLFMDGVGVFNFTIKEVPGDINNLLSYSKTSLEDIDLIFFHQSNKFIIDYLAKELNYPLKKIPSTLEKYGNTSCLSIPLTMVEALKNDINTQRRKIILSGYGVGFSWADAILEIMNCHIADTEEV